MLVPGFSDGLNVILERFLITCVARARYPWFRVKELALEILVATGRTEENEDTVDVVVVVVVDMTMMMMVVTTMMMTMSDKR